MSTTATPPREPDSARKAPSPRARMLHAIADELGVAPELPGAIAAEMKLTKRDDIVAAVKARQGDAGGNGAQPTPAAAKGASGAASGPKRSTTKSGTAKRTSAKSDGPPTPREGSALHAALEVLKAAREPLTPQEIYDRAKKRGLATGLKGKTPVATLAAKLATMNKAGHYVRRPAPGRYELRK